MKHSDYTEELRWLQTMAKELAASDEPAEARRYKGVNFFQGLWGYKEVALFLGVSPDTVKSAEFRRKLPALSLWQAKGTKEKTGQQVLRWRPVEVFRFRQEKEEQANRRLRPMQILKQSNG